ncbi:MAG: hypothetical protein HY719_16430 [Planctomycetes bacterium]|nr:hypothetical protein [Planctomycetota bacterium]
MLTIFAIPKPMRGHVGVIQANAIRSWKRLAGCQVILFGDDAGVAEIARDTGAEHAGPVPRNAHGTPLLDGVFRQAAALARNDLLCYTNADIILPPDLPAVAAGVRFARFLLVGRRWDLDVTEPIDFTAPDWHARLTRRVAREGRLHPPAGSDYFLFPRGAIAPLPPFPVGRPGWDNWLLWRCLLDRVPVIDATAVVPAVHQNHQYHHVPGGDGRTYSGPEWEINRRLVREQGCWKVTIEDADWLLEAHGLRRQPWTWERVGRFIDAAPTLHPRLVRALGPLIHRRTLLLFAPLRALQRRLGGGD